MTRHKSRVARRSRHRARRGTRKQSGGFLPNWLTNLFGSKPAAPAAVAVPGAPTAPDTVPTAVHNAPDANQFGGRKTRHRRRRRSPRRK